MLSFRLDAMLLRKVDMLRVSRHRTRGEIIREALELYFRAYNPVLTSSTKPGESDAHS
jgi:predicted transcriptional regulator